jgi:hypothetical protein
LHWLGEANQADGFPASDYVTVGHALVRIAREMTGIKWTTTTGSAWIRFFMWLQPHVQAGARQAAHPKAAYQQAPQQQAVTQQTVHQQVVRQQPAHPEVAYQQAAQQEAARQQATADHEAAHREDVDQAVRDTAVDVDVSALADLLRGEGKPVRDQAMPMTALDGDE